MSHDEREQDNEPEEPRKAVNGLKGDIGASRVEPTSDTVSEMGSDTVSDPMHSPRRDMGRAGPVANGVKLCGARTRKLDGSLCQMPAILGSDRCRLHGGLSFAGPSSKAYKHGRYSKHLPKRLRERYDEACSDDDLVSLRDELALVKVRLTELADRLQSGEGASLWEELREVYDKLAASIRAGDTATLSVCLNDLNRIIRAGNSNEETWALIMETMKSATAVNAAEAKRLVDLRQMISAEQAIALIMSVMAAVTRHVTDPHAQSAIHREVSLLLDAGGEDDG